MERMRIILIYYVLLFSGYLFSQTPPGPVITCVSVSSNSCSIKWIAPSPSDIAAFPGVIPTRYLIYRADNITDAFVEINPVTYDNTITEFTYTDPTANASSAERYYYVALEYFDTPILEVPSDTIASIYMNMDATNTFVSLDWNNDPVTEGPSLILQKKVGNTAWLDYYIGNNSFNHYEELINDCHGFDPDIDLAFRVRISHSAGCLAYSNEVAGQFQDLNPPDEPVVQTISVDPTTGQVQIYWIPSVAPDAGGYTILSGNNIPSGVVTGGSQNSFSVSSPPSGNDPSLGPVGYYVVPFDNCLHGTAPGDYNFAPVIPGVTAFHETVFLEAGYDVCSKSIQFHWTPYENWEQGVNRYVIEASIDGSPFQTIEIAEGDASSATIKDVLENKDYCFIVTAFANDIALPPSHSNKVCITSNYPEVAQDYQLTNVSVVGDTETEVTFEIDPTVVGARYRLEKLSEFEDSYESIGTFSQNLATGDVFVYSDFAANNTLRSDQYRVVAIDSCLNDVSTSQIMNSIHLNVFTEDGDLTNVLSWNPFINWNFGVQEYRVYYSNTQQMPAIPKFVVEPGSTYKLDAIEEFFHSETDFCYRVDAVESSTNRVSQSNVKCVFQSPRFFLPNAMVINGQNPIFQPKGGFIDFDTYELTIYNRWGILLFQTNDFFEGWDGTYQGDYVKEGVYAYTVRYKTGDAQEKVKAGALTVLRAY